MEVEDVVVAEVVAVDEVVAVAVEAVAEVVAEAAEVVAEVVVVAIAEAVVVVEAVVVAEEAVVVLVVAQKSSLKDIDTKESSLLRVKKMLFLLKIWFQGNLSTEKRELQSILRKEKK
mmetsp:Transcript_23430/g.35623  ORF Transcript_23430/g.35623 Transcript_23430/m.35623 type:complete len:117 (+) Transcript_23430:52-402(+)